MADLIKKIKIKKQDGTFTDYIPIGAEASNVSTEDGLSVENKLKKKPYYFDTVVDMKTAKYLKNGDMVIISGYYYINDGGAGKYKIREKQENDIEDNGFIHSISNTLVAELLIENNTVNIRSLGARSQDRQENKYDIKPYIDMYLAYLDTIPNRARLYIPAGIWYSSPCALVREKGFDIYGDVGFHLDKADGTIITSLNDNQEYVWQIGSSNGKTLNWVLKNIIFSSAEYDYRDDRPDLICFAMKKIRPVVQCLKMVYALFGVTDNLFFLYIKGRALTMSSCWENYFGLLNFRNVSNHDGSVVCFATADTTLTDNVSISATVFEKMMFECVHGDLIHCEHLCHCCNNHFGVINFEDYANERNGEVYTIYDDDNIKTFNEEEAVHQGIISLGYGADFASNVIDSMEINNISYRYCTYNNKTYTYDCIIKLTEDSDYAKIRSIINNISIVGMNKDTRIIKKPEIAIKPESEVIINSIENNSKKNLYFDVDGFTRISCDCSLIGHGRSESYLGNEFTPFHKTIWRSEFAPLYYDKHALNKLKLCTKAMKHNYIRFVIGGSNIYIRAKIPEGETCILAIISLDGGKFVNIKMVGTGEFSNYTFDISSKFSIGEEVDCRLSSSDTSTSCLLDYYKFY